MSSSRQSTRRQANKSVHPEDSTVEQATQATESTQATQLVQSVQSAEHVQSKNSDVETLKTHEPKRESRKIARRSAASQETVTVAVTPANVSAPVIAPLELFMKPKRL